MPEKLDLRRGASAAYTVAAWEAAGGQDLPGYYDGSEVDALLQRPVQGLVRRCKGSMCGADVEVPGGVEGSVCVAGQEDSCPGA